MIRTLLSLVLLTATVGAQAQIKHVYSNNQTFTHEQAIAAWQSLDDASEYGKLMHYGRTDIGKPLHVFVIDKSGTFDPMKARNDGKVVILVNNAIHPGEPCGVDASVKIAEDILINTKNVPGIKLDKVVLCFIPMYNVGGALNRGCCSRANQNGPEEYGFRGNAKNLDLNRDFVKLDSWNAQTFTTIFRTWNPDIFIDTHASNGADYQHVMTLIVSQRNKLTPALQAFADKNIVPELYSDMKKRGYPMVPYVHQLGQSPEEKGIMDYLETPRYSTGYAALYNCLGFVTETHMWKPYPQRVEATHAFLASIFTYASNQTEAILEARKRAHDEVKTQMKFPLQWQLDTTQFQNIPFMGFRQKIKKSEVTGLDRKFYDRKDAFKSDIKYYNTYTPHTYVIAPEYYIVPQAYTDVILRLQLNNVTMYKLSEDVALEVDAYYVTNYNTRERPYEFHYLHTNTEVETKTQKINYYKGDYVVPTNQFARRFIIEVLEPQGADSYFSWNFFDGILQQKEWFSDYIFEEKAAEILAKNPALKAEVEEMKKNPEVNKNHWAILYHIYKNSEYFEPTFMRYPVTRVTKKQPLPMER